MMLVPLLLGAERLTLRTYTTADGLTDQTSRPLFVSKQGYLWVSSGPDLARFDGRSFRIYSSADGWTGGRPLSMIETSSGEFLVGTGLGLYQFHPEADSAAKRFEPVKLPGQAHEIEFLYEDSRRRVWVSSTDGGYVREGAAWRELTEFRFTRNHHQARVGQVAEDASGDVWVGTYRGVYCFRKDGRLEHYSRADHAAFNDTGIALVTGPEGAVYVGGETGLFRLRRPAPGLRAVMDSHWSTRDGLPSLYVPALTFWKGSLWAGTFGGLARIRTDGRVEPHRELAGTKDPSIERFVIDTSGSLWIGTDGSGMMMAVNRGFTNFGEADGLALVRSEQILEDRNGELIVVSKTEDALSLNRFDGREGFEPHRVNPPVGVGFPWAWWQIAAHTSRGVWWIGAARGILSIRAPHADAVAHVSPELMKGPLTGERGQVFRLYEDSKGDVWAALSGLSRAHAARWEARTGQWHSYADALAEGRAPGGFNNAVAGFAEDRAGNIWIGCLHDGLWRFRNGRFEQIGLGGVPKPGPRHLHVDDAGRLWVASNTAGLWRVDDPTADKPVLRRYTTAEGLSSPSVNCVTSGMDGDIYLCTGRGVDRLNPATGRIRTYTVADGLIGGGLRSAYRDRKGAIWFGSTEGVSRFVSSGNTASNPPVFIQDIRIANRSVPVPAMGVLQASEFVMEPHEPRLRLEYASPDSRARYQHRLAGRNDWSAPIGERALQFEGLAPGDYRLQIRAVSEGGQVSAEPASVAFRVIPPFWMRWWFLTAVAMAMVGAGYALHRYRIEQILAIERVRVRIASDLHDDIGASLSQVSMLGTQARRSLDGSNPAAGELIERMAAVSREAVTSIGDIVWSIHPHRDKLGDLVQRMRRFASDLLEAKDIDFEMTGPEGESDPAIPLEARRDLLLIFKESVHNAARHSGCSRVRAHLELRGAGIRLRVEDDGIGIGEHRSPGNGLETMRARAERLGGSFELTEASPRGTAVSVTIPT